MFAILQSATTFRRPLLAFLAGCILASACAVAHAEGQGQADLDEALVKKLDATTLAEIQEVAGLVRSALAKGLDDENEAFAKELLGALSLQRGEALAEQLLSGRVPARAARRILDEALESLETAVEYAPDLAEAHLLIARLTAAGSGDQERARQAASKAIEALEGEREQQSEAYLLRSLLQTSEDEQMEDLEKALELNPSNKQAWQAKALLLIQQGRNEEAVDELKKLLADDPTNLQLTGVAVETLLQLERYDEALEIVDKAIEADPSAALYQVRSQIHTQQEDADAALADLDKALELEPNNTRALLDRAGLLLQKDDIKAAKRDINKALTAEPNSLQGVLLRSILAAEEGRLQDAINDIKLLARADPENPTWTLQLANLYQLDNRPRKAIEVTSELIGRDPQSAEAYRVRADAKLAVGDHETAIEDYERALEIGFESEAARSGLLNNLAWVYATSPNDKLRKGDRALELAKEAAELTEHKEPHILSTLAAAYAETGNFEEAVKWSEKAVELGKAEAHDQLEQLENELETYRKGEPFREKQEIEENKTPLLRPEDIIDT